MYRDMCPFFDLCEILTFVNFTYGFSQIPKRSKTTQRSNSHYVPLFGVVCHFRLYWRLFLAVPRFPKYYRPPKKHENSNASVIQSRFQLLSLWIVILKGRMPFRQFVWNPDLWKFHLWFFENPETPRNDPKLKLTTTCHCFEQFVICKLNGVYFYQYPCLQKYQKM